MYYVASMIAPARALISVKRSKNKPGIGVLNKGLGPIGGGHHAGHIVS